MGKEKKLILKNRTTKTAKRKKKKIRLANKENNRKKHNRNIKEDRIFDSSKFYEKISISKNKVTIDIPNSFDLIDNPDASLSTLKKLNYAIRKTNVKEINMIYSKCNNLGLDASLLTDLIVLNGQKYRKERNKELIFKGDYPSSYDVNQMFLNSGLLKHVNYFTKSDLKKPNIERIDPFENKTENVNEETNRVIDYINNCLKRNKYELNNAGINHFNKLAGEIIGNASEHSGDNGEWYVSGHFSQGQNSTYGKGFLTFISIGNTIYKNLTQNVKSKKMSEKIQKHLNKIKSDFDNEWNEETAITTFGLQYKVSSKKDDNNLDRGTGTIEFIDNFSTLGKTIDGDKPKMAIISGHTHILFDGTYNLKEKKNGNNKVKVIAFNKENDIDKKPDPKYVKIMQNYFPGVIISIEFYIDKQYLDKLGGRNEKQD